MKRLHYNAQTAVDIVIILHVLGHPQPTVPIKTDNATAVLFVTETLKQKCSKGWNVHHHWLSKQQCDTKFNIFWDKGANNLADYHRKHCPPSYHQK